MTVFHTTDWHYGHEKVALERGFPDVDEHNAHILDKVASQVKADDLVVVHGDLTVGSKRWENELFTEMKARFPRVRFMLLMGNHDLVHPALHRDGHNSFIRYMEVFTAVYQSYRFKFDGQYYLGSHFPYEGDHEGMEDRFTQWRLPDLGVPIVHGHTHRNETMSFTEAGTPQVHAGWDARMSLMSAESIVDRIRRS